MRLSMLRRLIAKQEAAGIRKLTGKRKLRVHVVGDAATADMARIVSAAMLCHEKKHGKASWTYTHAWRTVPVTAWQGAKVLASCDNVTQVAAARAKGYATAVIVPPHPTNKIYTIGYEKILPCPAQFVTHERGRIVTCESCTICQRPDFLRQKLLSVGFQPDGSTQKKILPLLLVSGQKSTNSQATKRAGSGRQPEIPTASSESMGSSLDPIDSAGSLSTAQSKAA
jgi:hypothetical protein